MSAPTGNERIWFNTKQAAEYGSCHLKTVALACRTGTLKASQPFAGNGGRWRIHRDDLDAWLRGEIADVVVPFRRGRSA